VRKLPPELQYLTHELPTRQEKDPAGSISSDSGLVSALSSAVQKEHGIARKVCIFVMATVLLGMGGISACAQPPPSTQTRSELSDLAEQEGARAAEAADAAARGSGSNDASKGTIPVTTESMPEKAAGPAVASTLLEERILHLVDSLRSPSSTTRQHLEEVMQVELTQDANIHEWWTHEGTTDKGWSYSILLKESKGEGLPSISIGFSSSESESADVVVCSFELEAFAKKLTALGYRRYPGWRQPRAHVGFDREIEGARFGSSIHVFKYVWKNGLEGSGVVYCVEGMNIYSGTSVDGE
jgi:hypothetical protein